MTMENTTEEAVIEKEGAINLPTDHPALRLSSHY